MESETVRHVEEDLPIGSFEETRRWQARLIFERTTPADRLHMLEGMLDELGDARIRAAIEMKLQLRERELILPPPSDR